MIGFLDEITPFLRILATLHLVAPAVAVLIEIVSDKNQHSPRGWALVYAIKFYWAAALNFALLLSLPLIFLLLIMGPGAILGFFISITMLGYYVVERVIGYDIKGSSFHGSDQDIPFIVGLLILSILSFLVIWKFDGNTILDRFSDWVGEWFRWPLIHLEELLAESDE